MTNLGMHKLGKDAWSQAGTHILCFWRVLQSVEFWGLSCNSCHWSIQFHSLPCLCPLPVFVCRGPFSRPARHFQQRLLVCTLIPSAIPPSTAAVHTATSPAQQNSSVDCSQSESKCPNTKRSDGHTHTHTPHTHTLTLTNTLTITLDRPVTIIYPFQVPW